MIALWMLLVGIGMAKMILYTINEAGQIQIRDGDDVQSVNGKNFKHISSSEPVVFATHKNGKLYHRRNFKEPWDKTPVYTLESPDTPIQFVTVSVLGEEYQWALTQAGDVYRSVKNTFGWDEAPQPPRSGKGDDELEGHFLKIVAMGEQTFGVCKTGALFELTKMDKWGKVEFEHSVADASLSPDGDLYIVSSDGVIFKQTQDGFQNIGQEGNFKSVEAVDDDIWALNQNGELFQFVNGSWEKKSDDVLTISAGEMPTDREGFQLTDEELDEMPVDFDGAETWGHMGEPGPGDGEKFEL